MQTMNDFRLTAPAQPLAGELKRRRLAGLHSENCLLRAALREALDKTTGPHHAPMYWHDKARSLLA